MKNALHPMKGAEEAFQDCIVPPVRGSAEDVPGYENAPAPVRTLLAAVSAQSGYLARLIRREWQWLSEVLGAKPDDVLEQLCAPFADSVEATLATLRLRKSRIALWTALCDLSVVWDLSQVTGALTLFADFACERLLCALVEQAVQRGKLSADIPSHGHLVILAMGKMGAGELNYSSDIDLIALITDDAPPDTHPTLIRIIRTLAKELSAVTADGYVFRTDLRLRPDAATTPVAVTMAFARRYYRDQGRTWERAAHIKARPCAGDLVAGQTYLDAMQPWIFRRHLDFAAIEDAHEMLLAIRDHKGLTGPITVPGHDLKLGRGGIREIEFFAQTRQLISAGRHPELRQTRTVEALSALAASGWIPEETANTLSGIYADLRGLEHRVQMLNDAQTHALPKDDGMRDRVAALAGFEDLSAFDAQVQRWLQTVHRLVDDALSRRAPETEVATEISPESPVQQALGRWSQLPVARSDRARATFDRVSPYLAAAIEAHSSPNAALAGVDRFITGLGAGVQVLTSLEADPAARALLVDTVAASPRLARLLGQRSAIFDAAFEPDFASPLPDLEALSSFYRNALTGGPDFEQSLDAIRRVTREAQFRVDVHVLQGWCPLQDAAKHYASIADAVIEVLLPVVIGDIGRRHGPPPGNGLAVLALGKLGTREMTAASDLDLILVYDPGEGSESTGPRPLGPTQYYARLTRALTNALTVPTAEGTLYEVDMRLRPSGRQGPVAVPLTGFRRYQLQDAWTWEHLALTRARVVAGPAEVAGQINAVLTDVRDLTRSKETLHGDLSEMRRRLAEAHPRPSDWDFKHGAGRLLDIDLFIQAGILAVGDHGLATGSALPRLADAGWISTEEADQLCAARASLMACQAADRIVHETSPDAENPPAPGFDTLIERVGVSRADLADLTRSAAAIIERRLA